MTSKYKNKRKVDHRKGIISKTFQSSTELGYQRPRGPSRKETTKKKWKSVELKQPKYDEEEIISHREQAKRYLEMLLHQHRDKYAQGIELSELEKKDWFHQGDGALGLDFAKIVDGISRNVPLEDMLKIDDEFRDGLKEDEFRDGLKEECLEESFQEEAGIFQQMSLGMEIPPLREEKSQQEEGIEDLNEFNSFVSDLGKNSLEPVEKHPEGKDEAQVHEEDDLDSFLDSLT